MVLVPLGELGQGLGHQPEALLRQDASPRSLAAIEEHPHVGCHVGGGGRDAAVGRGSLQPGGRHQGMAAVGRAVVVEGHIAYRQALTRVVGDHRYAGIHRQRVQDPLLDDLAVALAQHLLQDHPQHLVADVGVAVVGAWRDRRPGLAKRPGLVACLGCEIAAVDDACRMAQQMVGRDRLKG